MPYVTPADMQALYDPVILIQATNYSDRTATAPNAETLQAACDFGNRIVDGFLLMTGISPDNFSERFLNILKMHAARLAMDFLAGTDPQIREQAKESNDWLKSLQKLNKEELKRLAEEAVEPEPGETPPTVEILPQVSFTPGRSWRVTF